MKQQLLIYVTAQGRDLLERLTEKLREEDGAPHSLSSTAELAIRELAKQRKVKVSK